MQGLTGVEYITNEQHKETTAARIWRDMDDITKLIEFLQRRNRFTESLELHSIEMEARAMSHVNVEKSRSIGEQILKQLDRETVKDYIFKMKEQALKSDKKCLASNKKFAITLRSFIVQISFNYRRKGNAEQIFKYLTKTLKF